MKTIYRTVFLAALVVLGACEDLSELNQSENGIDQSSANPNLLMPTVMTGAANSYLDLGINDAAGIVQHSQKTGWYSGHNTYDWTPQDWAGWYGYLRTNNLIYDRAVNLDWKFHQGVALTMKSFIFGVITDLWGDAPYTKGVQGDLGGEFVQPEFDSQEVIYRGIIDDLKAASDLFATGDATGIIPSYDVYFGGDIEKWQRFANSLLLRYYMRISDKMPEVAKPGIEAVYNSGIFISNPADDATMAYIGASAANAFPTSLTDDGTRFRNPKPATTLLNNLVQNSDPRLEVWFAPVRVQFVEDLTLLVPVEEFIRRNGVITAKKDIKDEEYRVEKAANPTVVYTRHFNPTLFAPGEVMPVTGEYVGVPPGVIGPDYFNFNPTPGQTVQNQHVSQLDDMYRSLSGPLLKARLISAAESHFILAEAALKGWSVGDAEEHYNKAVQNSLTTWGVGGKFNDYIAETDVEFNGTLAQILEQKWIASWTSAMEAWFDFRRTGLPALTPGPASPEPVIPVRFIYGDNETLFNEENSYEAIGRLQATDYSNLRGKNSQWSKPWIIQGTGKPW